MAGIAHALRVGYLGRCAEGTGAGPKNGTRPGEAGRVLGVNAVSKPLQRRQRAVLRLSACVVKRLLNEFRGVHAVTRPLRRSVSVAES